MNRTVLILLVASSQCVAATTSFENRPFSEISSQLRLLIPTHMNTTVSGFYNQNANQELDGEFLVERHDEGYSEDLETNYKFLDRVKGQYSNNEKNGTWVYEHTWDDGIDVHESHTIKIEYQNNVCIRSQFTGAIGHIMPITTHEFGNAQYCTPQKIRARAYELWGIEYERRKANGEL
jgi:hypothetical protein